MTRGVATIATLLLLFAVESPVHAADEVSDGQWFHRFLKTAEAHEISKGAGVTVAVVDSGVDGSHVDLSGSLLAGQDFVANGDGQADTNGHGTAMAGLVAAHGRVLGVAPEAKIIPVRAGESMELPADQVALGVRWATANGARVISVSAAIDDDDLLLRQEVEAALAAGVVVVAAAGNRPRDDSVGYPAAIPGVVAVAGVGRDGKISAASVTGPEVVIAAPSDGISSTHKDGGYIISTGTSDATAIVAGAVALIRSRFPELSAKEVVRRLTATATDKGAPGRDNQYGYGVLNLVAALTADLPTATTAPTTTAPAISSGPGAPSDPDGLPWWLLAVLPIVAVAIVIWLRQRRTHLPPK